MVTDLARVPNQAEIGLRQKKKKVSVYVKRCNAAMFFLQVHCVKPSLRFITGLISKTSQSSFMKQRTDA